MNNRNNCQNMFLYSYLDSILCRHLGKIHCKSWYTHKSILCHNCLCSHRYTPNRIPSLPHFPWLVIK